MQQLFLASAAFFGAFILSGCASGTKLMHWKSHTVEDFTGVFFGMSCALLIGNDIFSCVYEVLCRANKAYNREDTNRNCKVSITVINQATAKITSYAIGDITAGAATEAAMAVLLFYDFYTENYRIQSFNCCCGQVSFAAAKILWDIAKACRTTTFEYIEVVFTAKQNYVFINNGYAIKILNS